MMKHFIKTLRNIILTYINDRSGSVVALFALSVPVVVTAVGVSVDLSKAHITKERLSRALDAAALATAAKGLTDEDEIEASVNEYLQSNYPEEKIGYTLDLTIVSTDSTLSIDGNAAVETSFMSMIGIDSIAVTSATQVKREVQGIEVVLVLDVTGSMDDYIDELEDAVEKFVNRMCEDEECPTNVKIGYVPFSTAVNVGPYGLGFDEDGAVYDTAFVNNPHDKEWGTGFDDWLGCVLTEDGVYDTDETYEGNWDMYRHPNVYSTSYYYYDYESYSHYHNTWHGRKYYYHNYNYICNSSYITPLTNDKDRLLDKADFNANGWTLINLGMIWGLRVLTPDYPFTEGAPWSDDVTKRVIVVMTDGDNDLANGGTGSSSYSAYGVAEYDGVNESDLDDKFAEVCTTAKTEYGIDVYTITFSTGVDEDTEELFAACASDADNYYDVDSASELDDAYDDIAKELSNLYVSE